MLVKPNSHFLRANEHGTPLNEEGLATTLSEFPLHSRFLHGFHSWFPLWQQPVAGHLCQLLTFMYQLLLAGADHARDLVELIILELQMLHTQPGSQLVDLVDRKHL